MDRRDFLRTSALVSAGLLAGPEARAQVAKAGGLPNLVLIIADDLGWGDLGCYGSQSIATPHLDRLAIEGARMTNFFSSASVCSPSRAGLLTGRYPPRTGITQVLFPHNSAMDLALRLFGVPAGLPLDEVTLADLLRRRGYATAGIGKWHLGDLPEYRPIQRGFDYSFGPLYSNDMEPFELYQGNEVVEPAPADQDLLTQKYTAEALGFIERSQPKPFFLYLPHTFPHRPLHASKEFRGSSQAGLYGDTVEEIDFSTGQILEALARHGLDQNTLILFTSDNGPWFQGSPGGYRGRKNETFDGGMRVPLLARWPGRIPPGQVTDGMAMNIDLFTTLLAAAGAPPPSDRPIDGQDLLPLLAGNSPSPHQALYFYQGSELQAIRVGNWKFHRRHRVLVYPFGKQGPWLFDLEKDPNESYDCSLKYPEKARKLEQMMQDWEATFQAR
jgi:arylsulfatase A-like enzyme